jgi:formate dehydrogenase alpha subunit
MRQGLGCNNIDSLARLGYAPVQEVLRQTLGFTGASATIDRLDTAAAIFVLGCDLNAESTAMEYRVIKACTKNNAKLVLANMRQVKLAKFNHGRLAYRPGTELALVNGLCRVILDEGLENREALARSGADLDALKGILSSLSVADAAAITGVTEADLREAARILAAKPGLAIVFGSDVIRGLAPEETTRALANLAILTGAVGGDQGGLFPVDERNNVQGMLDMGVAPANGGKDLWQIVTGIEQGTIRALYVAGTDLVATFPDRQRIVAALRKLELLVVQDIFANATTALAHVVLPGAAAAEKSGSFTTIDNRVQCLEKAVDPPGDAREDWDILVELHNRLAFVNQIATPKSLQDEIRAKAGYGCCCSGTGGKKGNGVREKLAFVPVPSSRDAVAGTVLLAGPILYHNGTMSTASDNNLLVTPKPYVEINAADAAVLGVADGGSVKVSAGAGSVVLPATTSQRLQAGMAFIPTHFPDAAVNTLFTAAPLVTAVRLEKA